MFNLNNTPKINYEIYLKNGISEMVDILTKNEIKNIDKTNIPDEIALTFDNLYITVKPSQKNLNLKTEIWDLLDEIDGLLKSMSDKNHSNFKKFWNYKIYLSLPEWQKIKEKLEQINTIIQQL